MSLPVLAARARDSWVVLHLSQLRKLTSLSLSLCVWLLQMGEGKVGTLREINVLGFVRILLEL